MASLYTTPSSQKRLMLGCMVLFIFFTLINVNRSSQFNLKDAIFLTKNSLKEFKTQYITNGMHTVDTLYGSLGNLSSSNLTRRILDFDLQYPFDNVVNSIFPIDTTIAYNITHKNDNVTTHKIIGRYASYSPILTGQVSGNYMIFPNNACGAIDKSDYEKYEDKILVLMRGNCSFVDKVENIVKSDLNPRSIIIGNDQPNRGLITMYSNVFNTDGSIKIPIMFISYESYQELNTIKSKHLELTITTVAFGSLMNIVLSMILSPPLLIFLLYTIVKCIQHCREKQLNRANEKFVRSLPVYIYNKNHLISCRKFYDYLKVTNQTDSIPFSAASEMNSANQSILNETPKTKDSSSKAQLNNFNINGVNIESIKSQFHILTAPDDFFFAYKCPICLDKFTPLGSRVLVLDCKHCYHEKCLSNWLINFRRSCPLCNKTIKRNDTHYLLSDLESSSYGSFDEDLEAQVLPSSLQSNHLDGPSENSSPRNMYSEDRLYTASSINEEQLHSMMKGHHTNKLDPDSHNIDSACQYGPLTEIHEPFLSTSTGHNSPKLQYETDTASSSPKEYGIPIEVPSASKNSASEVSMSDASSFVSAKSHFDSRRNSATTPPITQDSSSSTTPKYYAKPWEILSKFAPPKLESLHEISSSVDSEDFATSERPNTINDSDDSTIDGQSVSSSNETYMGVDATR